MKEQDIPYRQLETLGLDPKTLTKDDLNRLLNNQKTEVHPFSIEFTPEREAFLKKENIEYDIKTDTTGAKKLEFQGRIMIDTSYFVNNTPENIDLLNRTNVQYEKAQGNEKLLQLKDSLALAAALIQPQIGAILLIYYAMKIIPKRLDVKNEMGLSRNEINSLQSGQTIQHRNKENEVILMQLDKATNSISTVKQSQINPPDEILGQKLTQQDKVKILMGESVQFPNGLQIKLDLFKSNGIQYKDSNGNEISMEDAKQKYQTNHNRQMKM